MEIIISSILFVAVLIYCLYKRRQASLIEKSGLKKAKSIPEMDRVAKSEFRCVMINPGHNACDSAHALKGKPVLMSEAVPLPLQSCDKGACDCKFSRHEDRRMSERRNDIYVAKHIMVDENNNRTKADRRSQ